MATISTRINSSGTYLVNGDFDEWTGAPVVDNSLVLWLDAGQETSYPGNGTTWTSIAATSSTSTLVNGPAYTSDLGGYITFDGVNDYVSFSAPNLSTDVTVATIEMWVKIKGTGARMPFGFTGYDVYLNGGNLGYNTGANDLYGIPAATVTSLGIVGNWKHLVFVMQNNTSLSVNPYTNNKIYVDGVIQSLSQLIGTQSGSTRTFNNGVGVISGWNNNLTQYKALMDVAVFKIHNRELTATEIQKNFNALAPRYNLTPIANVTSQTRTKIDTILASEFDEVTFNNTTPVIKNLISYSQDFTQWSKNTAPNDYTVVSDSELAPDVTQTADLIIKSTGVGSSSIVYKLFSGIPNTEYCGSIYVKAGGYSKVSVRFGNTAFANQNIGGNFDLVTGTVNSILNGSTVTINSAENGWWRISITATSDNDGGNYVFAWVPLDDAYNANFTGNGTSGVYAWGAQVEIGSTATIYQGIAAANTLVAPGFAKRETSDGTIYVTQIFDEFTGAPVVDSSLMLWLDAAQSTSYPGTGTTWTDLSTNTNNGVITSPVYNNNYGGYFNFLNGSNYATLTSSKFNVPYTGKTVFVVARMNSSGWTPGVALYRGMLGTSDTVSLRNFNFYVYKNASNSYFLHFSSPGAATLTGSLTGLTNDTWFIAAVTNSTTAVTYYLNGENVYSNGATLSQYNITTTETIGKADGTWNGDIAQVMIYNRALTADEIQQNFNALRRRYSI